MDTDAAKELKELREQNGPADDTDAYEVYSKA
jgi:hypothetical protein